MPSKENNLSTRDCKIAYYCDIISRWAIYIFVWMLPISKALIEITVIIAFVSWLVKHVALKDYRFTNTGINSAIILFFVANVISVIFSTDKYQSLNALFFKVGENIIILFITAEVFSSKKSLRNLIYVMIASFALLGIDSIYQRITGVDFIRGRKIFSNMAVTGSLSMPTDFGGWLTIMLSLVACLFWFDFKQNKAMKIISGLSLIIGIPVLVLTYAKGAWISIILGMTTVGIIKSKKLLAILLMLIIAILIFSPMIVRDEIKTIFKLEGPAYDWRFSRWHEVLLMIADRPFFGFGLNTFIKNYPDYYADTKYYPQRCGSIYAHNCYLQMAAEIGLVGLGCFLYFLFIFLVKIFNTLRVAFAKNSTKENNFYIASLLGLLAGFIAFAIHSSVDTNMYSLQLGTLFWLTIGLSIAVTNVLRDDLAV